MAATERSWQLTAMFWSLSRASEYGDLGVRVQGLGIRVYCFGRELWAWEQA